MKVYAVIDTNILVSALFAKHFPIIPRVITPKVFLDILKALEND